MTVRYAVRREEPNRHYLAVQMEFDAPGPEPIDLVLPSWVPGSYLILDYARFLVDVRATAGPGGPPVPVTRIDKARWRVGGAPGPREVRYRVYGHQMANEAVDVTDGHLFLNGGPGFLYLDGRRGEACELAVEVPSDWTVVTELPEAGGGGRRYRAATYDELLDSPLDAGTPSVATIAPAGIRHRVSVCGPPGNFEAHRFLPDLDAAVAATIRYFGDSPLHSYTFFYHLNDVPDGALEHASSNSCVLHWLVFRPRSSYTRALWVAAHEYVHLYLVKRIQPKVFDPFDYTREVHTKLLWLMEGTTDYLALLQLRRSGFLSPAKFLEYLAGELTKLLQTPGRHHQSLEQASFLAWIGLYKPQEESINRSISYYTKGHVVSALLDLELRQRTQRQRSLQDVLRLLWTEYGKTGRGVGEDEFPEIVARATGVDIADFHRRFIAGTEEPDWDAAAHWAGLTFGPVPKKTEPEDDGDAGYLGADLRVVEGLLKIQNVRDGGPAQAAGLAAGDELVALDGVRVSAPGFDDLRKRFPPGTVAQATVFRRGYLTQLPVTFGAPPPEKYRFEAVADATELAKGIYQDWLGAAWTPPKRPDDR